MSRETEFSELEIERTILSNGPAPFISIQHRVVRSLKSASVSKPTV